MLQKYSCKICSTVFTHKEKRIYCGKHYLEGMHQSYIERWKSGLEDGLRGKHQTSMYIHRYIRAKQNNKCLICGIEEHNGLPLYLELDHIDGNYKNNKEENLRAICPNCHSQTPTYKAKNKGNGRDRK